MSKKAWTIIVIAVLAALALGAVGCGGQSLDSEFTQSFEENGATVKSVQVDVNPHEGEIMADLMILNSHGITNAREEELIHATVTLENGEEVSAVKYQGEIYTYKN